MKASLIRKNILSVVAVLFGLMFINSGLDKFLHYMPVPKDLPEDLMKAFGAFMQIGWILPLVAVAEILGGLLIIFQRTRALGALIIFPVMVGVVTTTAVYYKQGLPMVIILAAILVWILVENRNKYLPLVSR